MGSAAADLPPGLRGADDPPTEPGKPADAPAEGDGGGPAAAGEQEEARGGAQEEAKVAGPELRAEVRERMRRAEETLEQVVGGPDPRPLTEISQAPLAVLRDAFLGLALGMIPGLGSLLLVPLVLLYFFGNLHIHLSGAKDPLQRSTRFLLAVLMPAYSVVSPSMQLLQIYREYHRKYDEMRSDGIDDAEQQVLEGMIESLRFASLSAISSIASVLLTAILVVNATKVSAEVEYYKARAWGRMSGRSSELLLLLQREFPDFVRHPETLPASMEAKTRRAQVLLWVPTVLMFACSAVMCAREVQERAQLFTIGVSSALGRVLSVFITTKNYHTFLSWLTDASLKLERNAKQLVLFKALAPFQDCSEWQRPSKKLMRDMLRQHSRKGKAACGIDTADGPDSWRALLEWDSKRRGADARGDSKLVVDEDLIGRAPDVHLSALADLVLVHQGSLRARTLDLRRAEDVEQWWELRQYMSLDFTDESCIADFTLGLALIIVSCFLLFALTDWTTHRPQAIATSMLLQRMSPRAVLEYSTLGTARDLVQLLSPVVGTAMALVVIITLSILLFDLMRHSVHMNQLLQMDHAMLLDTVIKLEREASTRDGADHASRLLQAIIRRMEQGDEQQQRLLGIVIDDRLVQGLQVTILGALANLLWTRLRPVVQDSDRALDSLRLHLDSFMRQSLLRSESFL